LLSTRASRKADKQSSEAQTASRAFNSQYHCVKLLRINNAQGISMQTVFNTNAPKKAANLSVNSELLNQAKALQINLSAVLERALAEAIRDKQRQQWLQDNLQSIKDYNQRVETEGCFSDSLRNF
jgi:antitoxin CcdA